MKDQKRILVLAADGDLMLLYARGKRTASLAYIGALGKGY